MERKLRHFGVSLMNPRPASRVNQHGLDNWCLCAISKNCCVCVRVGVCPVWVYIIASRSVTRGLVTHSGGISYPKNVSSRDLSNLLHSNEAPRIENCARTVNDTTCLLVDEWKQPAEAWLEALTGSKTTMDVMQVSFDLIWFSHECI